jgi:uncharacterized phiE125 gp8 family phage protein
MMLTERTTVPKEALPISGFRDHLRLGTGFSDDMLQDGVLEGCLRAAIAAVEARTGKSLLVRSFTWSVTAWRDLSRNTLPVAPVVAIHRMSIVDRFGAENVIDPARYVLEKDAHRPRIAATSLFLPSIPIGGSAEIQFDAGYAETWTDLPADLSRAVFLLAAHYYENRSEGSESTGSIPYGVAALLDRYRNVRLFGGAA